MRPTVLDRRVCASSDQYFRLRRLTQPVVRGGICQRAQPRIGNARVERPRAWLKANRGRRLSNRSRGRVGAAIQLRQRWSLRAPATPASTAGRLHAMHVPASRPDPARIRSDRGVPFGRGSIPSALGRAVAWLNPTRRLRHLQISSPPRHPPGTEAQKTPSRRSREGVKSWSVRHCL